MLSNLSYIQQTVISIFHIAVSVLLAIIIIDLFLVLQRKAIYLWLKPKSKKDSKEDSTTGQSK